MLFEEFIELNLPIGTKVRYKEKEWLYLGIGIDEGTKYIQLARNDEEGSYPYYDYIASWRDDEIEVIEYPVKYMSIAKYHVGDMVYHYDSKCMVLKERNNYGEYLIYRYDDDYTYILSEEELSLDPTKIPSDEIKEETKEKGE